MLKRIAIVDDDAAERLLIELMVEDRYVYELYADADAAIAGVLQNPPDVLISDIEMPRTSGFELLEQLRKVAGDLPVIAFTGHDAPADRARFIEAGFDGYVSKPILSDSQLFDEIDRVVAAA